MQMHRLEVIARPPPCVMPVTAADVPRCPLYAQEMEKTRGGPDLRSSQSTHGIARLEMTKEDQQLLDTILLA